METFKLAHREYVERILENASGDEEEMYLIIGGCNNYLKEGVGQVHDFLALYFNFKYKLQVSKLKIELSRKFEDYNREESRAKLTISRLHKVLKKDWRYL